MVKRVKAHRIKQAIEAADLLPIAGDKVHNRDLIDMLSGKVLDFGVPVSALFAFPDKYLAEYGNVPTWGYFRQTIECMPALWNDMANLESDMLDARAADDMRNSENVEDLVGAGFTLKIAGMMKNMKLKASTQQRPNTPPPSSKGASINLTDEQLVWLVNRGESLVDTEIPMIEAKAQGIIEQAQTQDKEPEYITIDQDIVSAEDITWTE